MDKLLRGVLCLIGVVIIWLGLNISLGGIQTLGWQGATNFIAVTNADVYAVQDNHVRFIAGVWTGLGGFMLMGGLMPTRFASVLKTLIAMVFLGGLARLTAADPALLTGAKIAPSLIAELIMFPLLALWIHKTDWT